RCLNDEMAKDIGRDVVAHASAWAANHCASRVEFTYGVLYGTKRQSNKKDWHVLRNIAEAARQGGGQITQSHAKTWQVQYCMEDLRVSATVRVRLEWWSHLGGRDAWLEVCTALIRACVDLI